MSASSAKSKRALSQRLQARSPSLSTPRLTRRPPHGGLAREIVNKINTMRRDEGFAVSDRIAIVMQTTERVKECYETYKELICHEVLAHASHFRPLLRQRMGPQWRAYHYFHCDRMSANTAPPVLVVPYQKSWPHAFEEEAQKLKKVFSALPSHFYHIGSTSIPGCSAKPIIDILGVVADVTRVDDFNAALIELGFEPLGEFGMKQRRFFRKRSGVQVNVHIFEDTDPEVERHLRFCDYLRRHPEALKTYSALKLQLAEQFISDRDRYTLGKEKFIKTIDIAAAKEANHFFATPLKNPERKNRWTHHEIIEAMEANKHLHMTSFTKYIPAIERVFEPDVTVVRSEIPSDTFNYILDAHFTSENASKRVAHVLRALSISPAPLSPGG